jgi:hypothetical protein
MLPFFGPMPPEVIAAMQFGAGAADPQTSDAATARAGESAQAAQPQSGAGQAGQFLGDLTRGFGQEGLSGLLDFSGMMDRQQAQRDLSTRFQVVGDDFTGERKANMVSQEEYEEIAHTFSDIRLDRGDLTMDTSEMSEADAKTYRDGTMTSFADMMMTEGGRSQIEQLHDNELRNDDGTPRLDSSGNEIHHKTTLKAAYSTDEDPQDANEDGVVDDADKPHYNASNWANDNAFARAADPDKRFRHADGSRGDGSDATVFWNPTADVDDLHRPDVILAHELQHALHHTQGTNAMGKVTDSTSADVGGNNRERQAQGLSYEGHHAGDDHGVTENQYRKERNALGLGDRLLPQESYQAITGEAANDADLEAAWDHYDASGQDASNAGPASTYGQQAIQDQLSRTFPYWFGPFSPD